MQYTVNPYNKQRRKLSPLFSTQGIQKTGGTYRRDYLDDVLIYTRGTEEKGRTTSIKMPRDNTDDGYGSDDHTQDENDNALQECASVGPTKFEFGKLCTQSNDTENQLLKLATENLAKNKSVAIDIPEPEKLRCMDLGDEYAYFKIFALYAETYFTLDPETDLNYLMKSTQELGEIMLMRKHDQDGLRFKSGEVIMNIFRYCSHDKILKPCRPCNFFKTPEVNNNINHVAKILCLASNIIHEHTLKECTPNYYMHKENLQYALYEFSDTVLEAANVADMHDLMSLAIQGHYNSRILSQRLLHIHHLPSRKQEYEENTIVPWKYYWMHWNDAKTKELMDFLCTCQEIRLGKSFYLPEIVNFVCEAVLHKIYYHNEEEDDIIRFISKTLEIKPEHFNIRNPRSLQYPLMKYLKAENFNRTWEEKYPDKPKVDNQTLITIYGDIIRAKGCPPLLKFTLNTPCRLQHTIQSKSESNDN
jgi:hypothetical protein